MRMFRRGWRRVRTVAPIVVLLALTISAALVARDAAAVRHSVERSDLVFLEAEPSYERLWRLDTTMPYPARFFGIEDDLLYRHALRKYAAEDRRQQGRFNFSSPGLRAEAEHRRELRSLTGPPVETRESSGHPQLRRDAREPP
jgi:hypothetical protein